MTLKLSDKTRKNTLFKPDNAMHHFIQFVFITEIDEHFFYRDMWTHLHDNFVSNRQVTRDFYCLNTVTVTRGKWHVTFIAWIQLL